jgi:MacB-like periplasmic core domain/FtsX-like permease family
MTARAGEGVMRMRAVLGLAARELRARWLSWAVLILLVGVAGGVVLTTVAGARRTDSAYPRFLNVYKASDALVSPADNGTGGYDDALARLPSVAAIAPLVGLQALPLEPGGRLDAAAVVAAPFDDRYGRTLEIPKMLSGRLPDPDRAGEVAVDQIAAQDLHLRVGSTLEMGAVPDAGAQHIRRLHERVVGVMVTRGSVVPVTVLDRTPIILASTALWRELGPGYGAFDGAYVKLRPGATLGELTSQAEALAHRYPATGGQIFVADEATQAATVERSIRPQAVALALFAIVLAVTALLIVGQVASRQLLGAARDNPTLAALGLTRRQLAAVGLTEVGAAAAAGAVLACAAAVAASPLMPIGPARLAEPDPGVSVDVPVLAFGFIGIVALLLARVGWPAWRLASTRRTAAGGGSGTAGSRSGAAGWLARAGAPVTAVTGVRLAFDPGQGRTAVPVRSAMLGLALSLAAVTAAATFGANLLHLVHTPRLYGQSWDAEVDLGFTTITPREFGRITAHVPGIAGWTYGLHGTVQIGNAVVPAIGLAPGRGPVTPPTLLAGRSPHSLHQIVLGASVLRLAGKDLGQTVVVTAAGRRKEPASIVGQAVFPYFGQGSFTPTDLGEGALVTASLLEPQSSAANGPGYNFVLLRFDRGPRQAADMANFERAMAPFCAMVEQATCLITDQRPNSIVNYARIDGTPEVLAGIIALLGLAVLAQFAVVSARRRRRDFAILRTLGLLRGQLIAVTAWQAAAMTGLALLVGLPLGVAGGHWGWGLFAGQVGLGTAAIMPLSLLLLTVPTAFIAAIAITLPSGRRCARLNPAAVLRSE